MGDVIKFPISRKTKGITGRDGYIIAKALYLAIKWIDQLPKELRSESDKLDMLQILNTAFPDWEVVFGPLQIKIPELQACIAEALYDVDSIVADPEAYTKEELATLRSQIVSNLERAWEITGSGEDDLASMMLQMSRVVAKSFE